MREFESVIRGRRSISTCAPEPDAPAYALVRSRPDLDEIAAWAS